MENILSLRDRYKKSKYKFNLNGKNTVRILKEAFDILDNSIESDFYGNGGLIENFEGKFAKLLGKESAVFMPSGVMAQLIALKIYADESKLNTVAYHPLSHLEIHENDAVRKMHNLNPILLGDSSRLFNLKDLKNIDDDIATLLIELPQRELGGILPTYSELKEITGYARSRNIKVHMDGARLFEAMSYYDKEITEVTKLFDSVYISFYKGIGSIAGAILAGDKEFIQEAKLWKRRFGGDLISLYPYIVPADYYYEKRKNNFRDYCDGAKCLANYFNEIDNVYTVPKIPMTNMFHVFVKGDKTKLEESISKIYTEYDLSMTGYLIEVEPGLLKFEISINDSFIDIPTEILDKVFTSFDMYFNGKI